MKTIGFDKKTGQPIIEIDGKTYRKNPESDEEIYRGQIKQCTKKIEAIHPMTGWRIQKNPWDQLPSLQAGSMTKGVTIRFYADLYSVSVTTSGHYLYLNKLEEVSIDKAIFFAVKIMEYVNYGRYALGITSNSFE